MTAELSILGWTLVLAIVQIFLPSGARGREAGGAYALSARDDPGPPVGKVTARLQRAEKNLFETLPLFAAAVLIAHVGGREGALTLWGAWAYLIARIVYVPLYAFAVPVARTVAFLVSLIGLLMILFAILHP